MCMSQRAQIIPAARRPGWAAVEQHDALICRLDVPSCVPALEPELVGGGMPSVLVSDQYSSVQSMSQGCKWGKVLPALHTIGGALMLAVLGMELMWCLSD
jgi:hypothetical protein